MKIKNLKYTAEVQSKLGSKTMPAEWLHVLLTDKGYAIYVWDTREVLETNSIDMTDIDGKIAKDSWLPLKSSELMHYAVQVIREETKSIAKDSCWPDGAMITAASKIARKYRIPRSLILAGIRPTGSINGGIVWDENGKIVSYSKVFGR